MSGPLDLKNQSVAVLAIRWLSSQPFTNVLLIVQMFAMAWLLWYAITTAVPQHLQLIQDGYDRQQAKHRESLQIVIDSYEKTLDRIQQKED